MPDSEYQALFDQQRLLTRSLFKSMTLEQLDEVTHRAVRGAIASSGRVKLPSLREYIAQQTVQA